jgi:hypothetical protein
VGFRLNRTYVLEFEGALAGAEVKIRSTSVGVLLELRDASSEKRVAELLASHLVEWNLENEIGDPIPLTVEGVLSLEGVVLGRIAREWYRAASGLTAPLDDPMMEASLEMNPL